MTLARQPQEYIITADELKKLMSWSTHKSPGVCQYERRLEILQKVETRPHTSAPAPEVTSDQDKHAYTEGYKLGIRIGAKAAREQDQKQWQKLEDYINTNSPWMPGTDDRVTDARKLIAKVRSLRQPEPQPEGK